MRSFSFSLLLLLLSLIVLGGAFVSCGPTSTDTPIEEVPKVIVNTLDWVPLKDPLDFPHQGDLALQRSLKLKLPALALITLRQGKARCNGVFVAPTRLLTSSHCWQDENELLTARVRTSQGEFTLQRSLLIDPVAGIAVLQTNGPAHSYLSLADFDFGPVSLYSEVYLLHINCNSFQEIGCTPVPLYSPGIVVDPQDYFAVGDQPHTDDIFYTPDTLKGSSGAILISATTHKIIAIHSSGHGATAESRGLGLINGGKSSVALATRLQQIFQ